jgi:hypothetical protein
VLAPAEARLDGPLIDLTDIEVRGELGVWIMGLVVTLALAVLGAIAGSEYNLFSQLNLPRIPIDEGSLATGAIIALLAILVGTVLAAMSGGKVGERYHRKVDRAGYEATP